MRWACAAAGSQAPAAMHCSSAASAAAATSGWRALGEEGVREGEGAALEAEAEEGPDRAGEEGEVAMGGDDPALLRAGPDRARGRGYDRGCARDDAAQALDQPGEEEG